MLPDQIHDRDVNKKIDLAQESSALDRSMPGKARQMLAPGDKALRDVGGSHWPTQART
jgi:hypothetical protein